MEHNKKFDRILREKLENIQPEYFPESWDIFEQKLDADGVGVPETNVKDIDEIVFNKLHQLEVPYNAASWNRMSTRLAEEFSFTHKLVRYKAIELSLLLLLFFTFFQYLPRAEKAAPVASDQKTEQLQSNPSSIPTQAQTTAQDQEPLKNTLNQQIIQKTKNQASINNKAPNANNALPSSASEEDQSLISQSSGLPGLANNSNPGVEGLNQANKQVLRPNKNRSTKKLSTLPILNYPLTSPTLNPSLSDLMNLKERTTGLKIQQPITPLSPIKSDLLGLVNYDGKPILPKNAITSKNKPKLRFGMLGSTNYDHIVTPPVEVEPDSIVSLDRYALGYGGGFTLGFEWGRWELETGAIYSAKKYDALPVVYLDGGFDQGYYGVGYKTIEFNIFTFPLNIRYNYLLHNRWRLYALAGGSMQVVGQANYYKADQQGFNFPDPSGPPSLVPPGTPPSAIEKHPTAEGLLEGGSLTENSYITFNAGMGIERYMSTRWSIFAQPTYYHSLVYFNKNNGFGPYKDKFNTMSIYFGVKIRL